MEFMGGLHREDTAGQIFFAGYLKFVKEHLDVPQHYWQNILNGGWVIYQDNDPNHRSKSTTK